MNKKTNYKRIICMVMILTLVIGCTSSSACVLYGAPLETSERGTVPATEGEKYVISYEDEVYVIRSAEDPDTSVDEDGVVLYRWPTVFDGTHNRYYGVKVELGSKGTELDESVLMGEDGEYIWTAERCGKGYLFRNEAEPDSCVVIDSGREIEFGELIVIWWKTRDFKNVLCLKHVSYVTLTQYGKFFH